MARWTWLLILALVPGCSTTKAESNPERSYAGTVQRVFQVVLQGQDLPGIRFMGRVGAVLAPKLRQSGETLQYVVRTPSGQIMAQSDDKFAEGDCVEVIPVGNVSGPAFRYGQAQIVRSEKCTT